MVSNVINRCRDNVVDVIDDEAFVVVAIDDDFAPSSKMVGVVFSDAVGKRSYYS